MIEDLHIHTTASDGSDSFEQVLALARIQGLSHVAFTNHDTLSGIVYARSLSQRYQVEVIGGIEISAWDSAANTKAHILGLGFCSEMAPAITQLCAPLLQRRRRNTLWQMEQLRQHGISFSRATVDAHAQKSTCVYKQHVMAALPMAASSTFSFTVRCSRTAASATGISSMSMPAMPYWRLKRMAAWRCWHTPGSSTTMAWCRAW